MVKWGVQQDAFMLIDIVIDGVFIALFSSFWVWLGVFGLNLSFCDVFVAQQDEEIFDDNDFYHHILREFIQYKNSYDPIVLTK